MLKFGGVGFHEFFRRCFMNMLWVLHVVFGFHMALMNLQGVFLCFCL